MGSLHEDACPLPACLHAQNANGEFLLRHIGIDPEHVVEVPHLHWPFVGSQPSDPSEALQLRTLLAGQRSVMLFQRCQNGIWTAKFGKFFETCGFQSLIYLIIINNLIQYYF